MAHSPLEDSLLHRVVNRKFTVNGGDFHEAHGTISIQIQQAIILHFHLIRQKIGIFPGQKGGIVGINLIQHSLIFLFVDLRNHLRIVGDGFGGVEAVPVITERRVQQQGQTCQQYQKQNLLAREFTADHPDQIWVSDITYFKVKNYSLFLCVIIDLFSRKVVGYKVSHKSSTNLVTSTFRQAFQSRGCPENLTFHSDRGCQYTSETFRTLLKSCSVNQSFSHTGRPIDNAVAETFFATFKREEAYRRFYNSEKDFKKAVTDHCQEMGYI